MMPDVQTLYQVIEGTWPAAALRDDGPWVIRDGQGGGKRVSAATANRRVSAAEVAIAEEAMRELGQAPLVMVRHDEDELDVALAALGYEIVDPVNLYVGPVDLLTQECPPRTAAFAIWEPLAIQLDIWSRGGIDAGRIAVMQRATGPKTALFGRDDNRPAATGFACIHAGIAMMHALEVLPCHRRRNMARFLMQETAFWARDEGATHVSAVCTQANSAANALYASLGMVCVGHYHYRQKQD